MAELRVELVGEEIPERVEVTDADLEIDPDAGLLHEELGDGRGQHRAGHDDGVRRGATRDERRDESQDEERCETGRRHREVPRRVLVD